ncbi:MAG TPA: transposase [Bryobacteraceae bacterium]|jgi:REP element-mobilizing transposase RayT
MARHKRYFLKNQPLHLIQRGNNRQAIFFAPDDYARYREWLGEAAAEYGLSVHAYVPMTNHVHLLVTPAEEESVPRTLQSLGRRYVRHINRVQGRTVTLWEAATAPLPSTATPVFWTAAATSSSIRYARVWWRDRAIIAGRATAPMRWARRTGF